MGEMEDKLSAILNDPATMGKIMAMAQSLGSQETPEPHPMGSMPDMAMLQQLSGLASQSRIDSREQALLSALGAYLHRERIEKLEKAMRSARLAKVAVGLLSSGAFSSWMGR